MSTKKKPVPQKNTLFGYFGGGSPKPAAPKKAKVANDSQKQAFVTPTNSTPSQSSTPMLSFVVCGSRL